MVKIGSVVFELNGGKHLGQNWPILPNIATTTEPVLTNVSALVDVHVRIIKLTLVSQLSKGHCYGNQLILGDFCRCQNWPSSLFAIMFWKEMHNRLADARINCITNCSTSYKNGENRFSSFWVKVGERIKIVLLLGRYWTIFIHLAHWRSEMDWNITILISAVN